MDNTEEYQGNGQQGQQVAQGSSQGSSQANEQMAQDSQEGIAKTGGDLGGAVAPGAGASAGEGLTEGADAGGQGASQVSTTGQQSQAVERTEGGANRTGVLRPPVDVIEDAQGITLLADMPGVSKDNLNLRLDSQSLTIEGAMSLDGSGQLDARYAEIRHQHYERTFALSRELDGEKATAELSQGVLKIRIPKTAQATPRRIPVNVASA